MLGSPPSAARSKKSPGRNRAQTEPDPLFTEDKNESNKKNINIFDPFAMNENQNGSSSPLDPIFDDNTANSSIDNFVNSSTDNFANLSTDKLNNSNKSDNSNKNKTRRVQSHEIRRPQPTKKAPEPPEEKKDNDPDAKKQKSIDVLPLMQKGIRLIKFKMDGSVYKQRQFLLTPDNKLFYWESSSPFGKSNDDRSISVGSITEIRKNPRDLVSSLNFISHKDYTLTIFYDVKGQNRNINVMAYSAFHHQLVYDTLKKLSYSLQNEGRNLGEIIELFIDFDKNILPEHLRPQKFKWEALKQESNNNDTTLEIPIKEEDTFATSQDEVPSPIDTDGIDMFVPGDRNRISSF